MLKTCLLCGNEFETVKFGGKRIYCFTCNPRNSANSVTLLRRKARQLGIERLGGKCVKCGNSKHYLLEFHHRNPDEKDGDIAEYTSRYDLSGFYDEIQKCDLLCCNCHKEFHYLNEQENISYENYLKGTY
jgi:hypothetical protein